MLILKSLLPWEGTNEIIHRLEFRFSYIRMSYKQTMTYLSSIHAVISANDEVDMVHT